MGPEIVAAMQAAAPYLVVGGTAASMIGEQQANKQRRAILNRSLEATDEAQKKSQAEILDEGQNFSADKRQEAMQAAESAAYDQSQNDLGPNAGIVDTSADGGRQSADFVKAKADKAIGEGNRLTALSREVARTRAPGPLQNQEGMRRADLTGRIGSRWSTANNMARAGQLDASAVQAPGYAQLGKLAAAIGSAGGSGMWNRPGRMPMIDWDIPGGY